MRQIIFVVGALSIIIGSPSTAPAVIADSMGQHIKRGYHRNEAWPWPYVCPDRVAVREPFAIMVRNGWRHQNLLGAHHFNPAADKLTTAGELKVRWIMTQAPPAYRQIFIERAVDPAVTSQRIAAARAYATHATLDGPAAQVFDTHLVSEGRPAATVDHTNVRFSESQRVPVLPAPSGDASN